MNEKTLQFAATIESLRTLKDSSIKITVETQELPPDESASLFGYANKQIWIAFKDVPIKQEDVKIEEEKLEFPNQKSTSEMLYKKLFRLFMAKKGKKEDFEPWRKREMQKIINQVQNIIDKYE